MGSKVITIRVPAEIQEKMKRLNVNWSKIIREYIQEVIEREERRLAWLQMMQEISSIPSAEEGTAVKSVREDRDSR
jgi:predicted DNA-binding protein